MANIPLNTVLATERLRLRAVSYDDIPFVFEATRFPGFCDGMRWDPPDSPQELDGPTAKNFESWISGSQYTFTVDSIATGVPVGRIALRSVRKGVWYLGFWVDPGHWGEGIAPEAAKAVVEFAFSRLGARAILSSHATWNARSQSVIEQLGMSLIGENPCGFMKDGEPVAELEYALVRSAPDLP